MEGPDDMTQLIVAQAIFLIVAPVILYFGVHQIYTASKEK